MDRSIVHLVLLLVRIVQILLSVLVVLVGTITITLFVQLHVLQVIMLIMQQTHVKIVYLLAKLAQVRLLVCLVLWGFGMEVNVPPLVLLDNLLILQIMFALIVMQHAWLVSTLQPPAPAVILLLFSIILSA